MNMVAGKHDVGHQRRLGHELLVHGDEEILAGKAAAHQVLLRRHRHRIGVLDQHGLDRAAAMQRLGIAGQDAGRSWTGRATRVLRSSCVMALDDGLVEVPERVVVEEGAAAFILPGAGHGRDAEGRMHLRRAVAAAGEAVAEPEEGALGRSDRAGKSLDLGNRHA